jgi:hypothetical protein
VNLSWTASTGATSYNVLRSTSPGAEALLPSGVTSSTTYGDTTVVPGTTYYYEVEGVNLLGIAGPASSPAIATPSHISASISKSCAAATCTFTSTSTDPGGTITTYSWSVSGSTGTASTFRYTFSSAGTFSVELGVTDNEGSTGSASVNVSCTSYSYLVVNHVLTVRTCS